MTPKEMLLMRLDGATFQQIADTCGITKQAAHQAIRKYTDKIARCQRGRSFSYNDIKFKGIYEYFEANEEVTLTSFANAVFDEESGTRGGTIRNFLTGKTDSRFTISQIKRMCEICGKPFEEVFEERKGGEFDVFPEN